MERIKTIGFKETKLKFQLEYDAISKLLMGEALYESKAAGLRELLQNSIDAIHYMAEKKEIYNNLYVPSIIIELNKEKMNSLFLIMGPECQRLFLKNIFLILGSRSIYLMNTLENLTNSRLLDILESVSCLASCYHLGWSLRQRRQGQMKP